MTTPNDTHLDPPPSDPWQPGPPRPGSRAARPPSASKNAFFALLAVTLVLAASALALTAFNLRFLRQRHALVRDVLFRRVTDLNMATYPNVATPERREHLRACYKHPETIDFNKISWDLLSRPTPFLNFAPEPGDHGEGHFNAQQLRNRNDVALPKPPGVYRIFLTGGSFAYGIGAPTQDDTIPACLERILNERRLWPGRRVEVFNAAVPGWASTHERILAENRLCDWQPDLVIDLTGGNDAHWGFAGADVRDLRTYEDDLYLATLNTALDWAGARPYPAEPPVLAKKPLPPALVAERFVRNMRLAALALQSSGARLVVALQPTLSPTAKKLTDGERRWLQAQESPGKVDYLEACFVALAQALAASGPPSSTNALDRNPANLRAIPVRDVFKSRDDAIFFDLFHMADKGNELVAARLADELQKLER